MCLVGVLSMKEDKNCKVTHSVTDEFMGKIRGVEYVIDDKDKNEKYILSFRYNGYISLHKKTHRKDNLLAYIRVNLYGGDSLDLGSMDGLMKAYELISDSEFKTWTKSGNDGNVLTDYKNKKKMLAIMDDYIFNTLESKSVLFEYINGDGISKNTHNSNMKIKKRLNNQENKKTGLSLMKKLCGRAK